MPSPFQPYVCAQLGGSPKTTWPVACGMRVCHARVCACHARVVCVQAALEADATTDTEARNQFGDKWRTTPAATAAKPYWDRIMQYRWGGVRCD